MKRLVISGSLTVVIFMAAAIARADENCNTALTRIGRKAADRAIAEHQADACAGLKVTVIGVTVGLDDTKALELRDFKLCEAGPIVSTALTVHVQCSTGSKASVPASISDDLTATASANLDTCKIIDLNVSGGKQIVRAGLNLASVSNKLRDNAQQQITPYCK